MADIFLKSFQDLIDKNLKLKKTIKNLIKENGKLHQKKCKLDEENYHLGVENEELYRKNMELSEENWELCQWKLEENNELQEEKYKEKLKANLWAMNYLKYH